MEVKALKISSSGAIADLGASCWKGPELEKALKRRGEVLVNSVDTSTLGLSTLRSALGLVPQEPKCLGFSLVARGSAALHRHVTSQPGPARVLYRGSPTSRTLRLQL